MYTLKTQFNDGSVTEFLNKVEPDQRRQDAFELADMMREVTGLEPTLYGTAIVAFGKYCYTYDSGHSGESTRLGFSPRKAAFSLYVTGGWDLSEALLSRLGKHKMAKGCLYINKLADVDRSVLREIFAWSYAESLRRWPE